MSLKVTAFVAAIFSLASAALSAAQFVRYLSQPYAMSNTLSLISWPVGILASLTLAVFLFHLVSKQKRS